MSSPVFCSNHESVSFPIWLKYHSKNLLRLWCMIVCCWHDDKRARVHFPVHYYVDKNWFIASAVSPTVFVSPPVCVCYWFEAHFMHIVVEAFLHYKQWIFDKSQTYTCHYIVYNTRVEVANDQKFFICMYLVLKVREEVFSCFGFACANSMLCNVIECNRVVVC